MLPKYTSSHKTGLKNLIHCTLPQSERLRGASPAPCIPPGCGSAPGSYWQVRRAQHTVHSETKYIELAVVNDHQLVSTGPRGAEQSGQRGLAAALLTSVPPSSCSSASLWSSPATSPSPWSTWPTW